MTPPFALTSSRARSKPFFHCAPYCAAGPVSGPLTPISTGSAARARRGTKGSAAAPASRPRRVIAIVIECVERVMMCPECCVVRVR